jgi:hypothetical protein
MFYMSLKYIHSIFFTTCFDHIGPSSGNNLFFKDSIALHTVSLVLLSMLLLIWCYMVSPPPIVCIAATLCTIECAASW